MGHSGERFCALQIPLPLIYHHNEITETEFAVNRIFYFQIQTFVCLKIKKRNLKTCELCNVIGELYNIFQVVLLTFVCFRIIL